MNILGVSSSRNIFHDSAACLIANNKIYAIAEERLSRKKHDCAFPSEAIEGVLKNAGISLADVDHFVFAYPKYQTARYLNDAYHKAALSKFDPIRLLYNMERDWALSYSFDINFLKNHKAQYLNHHLAHAASAFFPSGFEEAAIIVVDGQGTSEATTIWKGSGKKIEKIKQINYPNSLGAFYRAATEALGFKGLSDEWKVMGLSSYGTSEKINMDEIISTTDDGYSVNKKIIMDLSFKWIKEKQRELNAPVPSVPLPIQADFARAAQDAFEKAMFNLVKEAIKITGCKKVCLAGGCALNSAANGKIITSGLVEDLFVQPASSDDGGALGACLYANNSFNQEQPQFSAYLGPEYSDTEIEKTLRSYGIKYTKEDNISLRAAELLANNKIIGWFQGGMEFGPRALGNRSILADPRKEENRDLVNNIVKFRESWRPFAPSVLEEKASEYFNDFHPSPYMTLTFKANETRAKEIPAVVHVDGTSRIQSVSGKTNPKYYELLKQFERLTGTPVVLNTSFNLKDEPIVCSPKDAIRTFFSCGLHHLAIGSFLIGKE